MDARSNPANVSDGLQNSSGHIGSNTRYRLTKLGEQMARLPIDPKIARILLAAKKHDCMAEILVIASALSIQDPRERPLEARDAAAKAHERFTDKQSDFLAYLNIWDSFQRERDKGLSNKQLVQWWTKVCPTSNWCNGAANISCRTCGCANGASCTTSLPKPRLKWV